MPSYRLKKLVPNTSIQIWGVWGLWDEGPPDGDSQDEESWSGKGRSRSSRYTIEWYSVTYLKLLSRSLYESNCYPPILNEKSDPKTTLSYHKIGKAQTAILGRTAWH